MQDEKRKFIIYKNEQYNGLELYPNGDLTDDEIDALKFDKWRYHTYKKCFYALATKSRYALLHTLFGNVDIIPLDPEKTDDEKNRLYKKMRNLIFSVKNTATNINDTQIISDANDLIALIDDRLNAMNTAAAKDVKMPF